jgi:hypothetical protein
VGIREAVRVGGKAVVQAAVKGAVREIMKSPANWQVMLKGLAKLET